MIKYRNLFKKKDFIWIFLFFFVLILSTQVGSDSNLESNWIFEIRLPRILLAFSVGAALSVAGAVLQAYFKNPLCEPYTLGVSSGAALGAVIGRTLGFSFPILGFSPSALIGAVLFSSVLLVASRNRRVSSSTLLLVGVMLGFLGSSLIAVWMAVGEPSGIQSTMSWLLGDLSRAEGLSGLAAFFAVLFGIMGLWFEHKNLDALLFGEEEANAMGIDLRRLRIRVVIWTSFLVAVSVSLSGMIGFVGLLVPQWIRRSGSALHFRVLPLSALAGGILLVFSDMIARRVIAPYELPVGVITAIIGAPFFIGLVLRGRPLK